MEDNFQKGNVYSTPEVVGNGDINMHPFAVYNLRVHCMHDFNALLYLKYDSFAVPCS